MTRQLEAHHAAEIQTQDFAAALVIHPVVPTYSIVELCGRVKLPGPARRAVEHARDCRACRVGDLCATGARLAAKIQPRRKRGRPA